MLLLNDAQATGCSIQQVGSVRHDAMNAETDQAFLLFILRSEIAWGLALQSA